MYLAAKSAGEVMLSVLFCRYRSEQLDTALGPHYLLTLALERPKGKDDNTVPANKPATVRLKNLPFRIQLRGHENIGNPRATIICLIGRFVTSFYLAANFNNVAK